MYANFISIFFRFIESLSYYSDLLVKIMLASLFSGNTFSCFSMVVFFGNTMQLLYRKMTLVFFLSFTSVIQYRQKIPVLLTSQWSMIQYPQSLFSLRLFLSSTTPSQSMFCSQRQ